MKPEDVTKQVFSAPTYAPDGSFTAAGLWHAVGADLAPVLLTAAVLAGGAALVWRLVRRRTPPAPTPDW